MWWLYVVGIVALLGVTSAVLRARARRRSKPDDLERWRADRAAAEEARERRRGEGSSAGPPPPFIGGG